MKCLIAAALMSVCFAAPALSQHWGYEGHEGPSHWGELNSEWSTCSAGQQQSPVDLSDAVSASIETPQIHWIEQTPAVVADNGHTIQASVENAGGITLDGVEYELLQFHFHAASEHTINGAQSPMEIHFVHASAEGQLAVLGVMVETGEPHPMLSSLWAATPGGHDGMTGVAARVQLGDFLPEDRTAFRYQGSLTTPPCSEIVSWTVFTTPIHAVAEQISTFQARHPDSFRPVQPLERRFVLLAD
jgi:carbonic anhydrase